VNNERETGHEKHAGDHEPHPVTTKPLPNPLPSRLNLSLGPHLNHPERI
jgi:hypothetical protein